MRTLLVLLTVGLTIRSTTGAPPKPLDDRSPAAEADTKTLKHLKIQGSLDLDSVDEFQSERARGILVYRERHDNLLIT